MSASLIRIATRKSPLALWQAEHVRARLLLAYPGLAEELLRMSTQGDRILDSPLAKVGGKGLFVKELEQALLDGRADIAVHSMKDVPVDFPDGLCLPVICQREDPRDAFVSNRHARFADLPQGARVGTSSLRRQTVLHEHRPDLNIMTLRGNVNTRLARLDAGEYDAIILAAAGLLRLGFVARITEYLEPEVSLPAIGQGAIGIECRMDDTRVRGLIDVLHDGETATCISAERAMNRQLQGGCQVPIAGYAQLAADRLTLRGLVGRPDGSEVIRGQISGQTSGDARDAADLGMRLADDLLRRGARVILNDVYADQGLD